MIDLGLIRFRTNALKLALQFVKFTDAIPQRGVVDPFKQLAKDAVKHGIDKEPEESEKRVKEVDCP